MEQNYWLKTGRQAIERRRSLGATGGRTAAAALLAACGSSGKSSSGSGPAGVSGDKSGLLSPAVDTSKQARQGGTVLFWLDAEPGNLDPGFANRPAETVRNYTMTRLFRERP